MKRGEVWTAAGSGLASMPRPVLIIQDNAFTDSALETVLVVPLTTANDDAPMMRVVVALDSLRQPSFAMVDKTMPYRKASLGQCLGEVDRPTLRLVERALLTVLGMAR